MEHHSPHGVFLFEVCVKNSKMGYPNHYTLVWRCHQQLHEVGIIYFHTPMGGRGYHWLWLGRHRILIMCSLFLWYCGEDKLYLLNTNMLPHITLKGIRCTHWSVSIDFLLWNSKWPTPNGMKDKYRQVLWAWRSSVVKNRVKYTGAHYYHLKHERNTR